MKNKERWRITEREVRKYKEKRKKLVRKIPGAKKTISQNKIKNDSCNSEHCLGAQSLSRIKRRINEIDDILNQSPVIEPEEIPTDRVGFGTKVTLYFPEEDKEVTYRFGIRDPEPTNNVISPNGPLAAIKGKKPGDEVGGAIIREIGR